MSPEIPVPNPLFKIKDTAYTFNAEEYISFLNQCEDFMSVEKENFEVMLDCISDRLINCADAHTPIGEIRPQIKLLKELGFFLKNIVSIAATE
ncbi:hypothetical protein GJU39_19780 [Pedobacter petrophilus]|uniref:Uncharacterized protein n=1 Tax=Pedobacter petrophilus TaxID=1908241 RepID=A0A7K0G3D3_9SPHI|nr:hypothetical protein [Pedobacter petrophilus]MRX78327.1 hypothetical protein [Pedobacter petrophilus]